MPAIEHCGQEIREWRPSSAGLGLGAQVVDCLQGKAVLICNSFWGGGERAVLVFLNWKEV